MRGINVSELRARELSARYEIYEDAETGFWCRIDGQDYARAYHDAYRTGAEIGDIPKAAWRVAFEITLAEAAEAYPIAYSTLAQAVREGRLDARQSGKTWLTTCGAIERAIREGKLRPQREPTIYRVAEDPEYWGPDCTSEWGRELAQAMAQALRQYAEANGLDVEIETVPETQSYGNRSQGDRDTINILDYERDRLFNSSPWEWARGTSAYDEWK